MTDETEALRKRRPRTVNGFITAKPSHWPRPAVPARSSPGGGAGGSKALWASGDKLLSGEPYDGGMTGPYDGKNPFA
jgi:hypothetical protein